MPVIKTLELSTEHLSPAACETLHLLKGDEDTPHRYPLLACGPWGWLLSVPAEPDVSDPAALSTLTRHARQKKCTKIYLDQDAPHEKGLSVFDSDGQVQIWWHPRRGWVSV